MLSTWSAAIPPGQSKPNPLIKSGSSVHSSSWPEAIDGPQPVPQAHREARLALENQLSYADR